MKKVYIILITVIYFISTCGVSGTNFYCCGKLKETFLFTNKTPHNACKKDNTTKGCCDNKVFFSKVKDDHAASSFINIVKANISSLLYSSFSSLIKIYKSTDDIHSLAILHEPPLLNAPPVYLSLKVFLI
jgi:hypothetical protein